MCKQCELNSVYEFTNKRKLCKRCFINYFQKKVLYTIKKFNMVKKGEVIGYKKGSNFRGIVLDEILKFIAKKSNITLTSSQSRKADKIAVNSSVDSESGKIIEAIIKGNVSEIKKFLPVYKSIIKPLYLFLDGEILLYAKLKKLKFKREKKKTNEIQDFMNEFEKKHPEVKRAIINGFLEIYK